MENTDIYNTAREPLKMPAYGRTVQKMIEMVKQIPDRETRCRQAAAVLKTMEILNTSIYSQENYSQMLWDHLQFIAGYCLDVDSQYPMPEQTVMSERPAVIPLKKKPVKAAHYGRNIESIIDLIAELEDSPAKTSLIRSLAIYMRQQYLIWNKDTVADSTIFGDLERLSDYRIKVPEDLTLSSVSSEMRLTRPGLTSSKSKTGAKYNRKK